MSVVIFDATEFKGMYPEFDKKSDSYLQNCFDNATLIISNSDCSIIEPVERKKLLYLLTAHFAMVLDPDNGLTGGIVNSATEGTISVSFNTSWISKENQFLAQTIYGQLVLNATKKYRSSVVIGALQQRQRRGVRFGS